MKTAVNLAAAGLALALLSLGMLLAALSTNYVIVIVERLLHGQP